MKSDFRKFRLFCRLGIIVAILVAQVCCVLFVGGTLGAAIGVVLDVHMVGGLQLAG